MRIAVIAPPNFPIPPERYGATERLVAYQVKNLVAAGHDVFLFAAGNSTIARNIGEQLGLDYASHVQCFSNLPLGIKQQNLPSHLEERMEAEFVDYVRQNIASVRPDVSHAFWGRAPLFDGMLETGAPALYTNCNIRTDANVKLMRDYDGRVWMNAVSAHHRAEFPDVRGMTHIYVGVDSAAYAPAEEKRYDPDKPLIFVGALGKNKGPKTAILGALEANSRIQLVGGPSHFYPEQEYFEELRDLERKNPGHVSLLGERSAAEIAQYLHGSKGFLFVGGVEQPSWSEPCSVAVIEALMSGVPVIAAKNGMVPEVIEHGRTGWICNMERVRAGDLSEVVDSIGRLNEIDPNHTSKNAAERFSDKVMTAAYLNLYQRMMNARGPDL